MSIPRVSVIIPTHNRTHDVGFMERDVGRYPGEGSLNG